jgi:tetraacyldisaccharide 4'-kinase
MKTLGIRSASFVWNVLTNTTRSLKRFRIITPEKLDSKVISVGNIQAGGAGKTPLVAQIAKEAHQRGMSVCILSRGYKGKWEHSGGVLMPGQVDVKPQDCGDEPALLHELVPHAWIGVGADRLQQYQEVLKKRGKPIDLVLLDDGFQNRRIHKDVEVVAVTSAQPGEVFFRESAQSLKNADLIVWTKGETRPLTFDVPLVRVRYSLPPCNAKQPLWLVTGIADGRSAHHLAVRSGYPIRKHVDLRDHFQYSRSEIRKILDQAQLDGGSKIALTGKDWVKWKYQGVDSSEVIILEPELIFEEGRELWSKILWEN